MFHVLALAQTNANVGQYQEQGKHDPIEITRQLQYARSIFKDSLTRSLELVESNLSLAIQQGYKKEEALAHHVLGEFYVSLHNYELATEHLQKAYRIYASRNDVKKTAKTLILIGESYAKNKRSEQAIQYWLKAEKLVDKSKFSEQEIIELQIKIGEEYLNTPSFLKAKPHYKKALQLSKQINSKTGIVTATIGLGKIEEKKGRNETAEHLFQSANREATAMNSVELTNSSLNSLSNLYQNSNNTSKSISIQEKAIDFNTRAGKPELVIQNSTEMANTLIELGEEEKAIDILKESSDLVENETNSEAKRNFYKTFSKAYASKGELEKSQSFQEEYTVLMDSFKELELQKQQLISARNQVIQNTETKIDLLEKDRVINEKTIQLLKQEQVIKDKSIKNQQIIMVFLIIGIVLVGAMIFFIFRNNQQKQRNNQLLTLKSLRNQMNPHFIFNSLNSVNVYIAQQDERAANKYLTDFSKLMRLVLNYSQNDFIPLSKELEILHLYLDLEHDRFKENFDYAIDCPNSIDLEAYQIPPMLLQPLVENAIWHGLRYKEEKGFLNIQFLEAEEGLKITITDNGIGREASFLHKTSNQLKMKSTGIKNVKDRLEIVKTAFRKELSIQIDDLIPETKEGTVVTILLKP